MLEALTGYRQWVVWKLVHRPGKAKADKIPFNALTGDYASSTDAGTWCSYNEVVAAVASGNYNGIGFIFTKNDPFVFIDLDSCRDAITGEWLPEAIEICGRFPGAAMEVSQSGTGAHIICSVFDKSLFNAHYNKWAGWIEFYRSGRFIAFGGGQWQGDPTIDHTAALLGWAPLRPAGAVADDTVVGASAGRDPRWIGPEDDEELLRRMMVHKEPDTALIADLAAKVQANPHDAFLKWQYDQAARERVPFAWLWNADMRLGQFYPDTAGAQGRSFDWSAADQALMNKLAFWTGKDWPRMQRLFAQSALAQRDKWRLRPYYQNATIGRANRWCKGVYGGNRADKRDEDRRQQQMRVNQEIGDEFREEDHYAPILRLNEMHQRFVYVKTLNALADRIAFKVYKMDYSETIFASSVTKIDTGQRDKTGQPIMKDVKTIRLWRENYRTQKVTVDKISWKPNGGVICDVPESFDSGVNMWRGLAKPLYADYFRDNLPERATAISWWQTHLAYLIPYEVERVRFEKWLAHILQRPEVLPHTAYMMYTPEVGTGRNWLSSVLVRVLRGYVAAGVDIQEVLDGSFNGRLSQKLLATVDEAKAGMQDAKRYARSEKLKTLVNQAAREINVKHGLQSVEHNCMRWLFFSNHADALPFDNNDRRIAVIANPTQRHPGGEAYYSGLYGLLDNDAFISAVWAHLMYGVDVSDFNPGEHAPMNEAKRAALSEMRSEGERAVREFHARCPGNLATAKQVREHIDRYCSDKSGTNANSRILNKWIERAGMVNTSKDAKINGVTQKIIIVRGYTAEMVATMGGDFIANIVGNNDIWLKLE